MAANATSMDTTDALKEMPEGPLTGSEPEKPAEHSSEGVTASALETEQGKSQTGSSTTSENDRSTKVGSGQDKGKTAVSEPSALKKVPNRPGITWQVGERIEAMDYLSKWYPAKMLEVDLSDQTVLIHFEGWNQRYDEWVAMHSDKLRPLTRTSDRKKNKSKSSGLHRIGDKVLARWTDGKMYPGKVTSVKSKEFYEIMFYDGHKKLIPASNVKIMSQEMKNKNFEAPPRTNEIPATSDPLSPVITEGKRIRKLSLIQRENLRDSLELAQSKAESKRCDKKKKDKAKPDDKAEKGKQDAKSATETSGKRGEGGSKDDAGVTASAEESGKQKTGGRVRQEDKASTGGRKAAKIEMKRRSSSKDGDSKKSERSQKPALRKGGKLIVAGAFSRFKTGHSPPIGKKTSLDSGGNKGSSGNVHRSKGCQTPVTPTDEQKPQSSEKDSVKAGKSSIFMEAFQKFTSGGSQKTHKSNLAYKKSVSDSGRRKTNQASPSRRRSAPVRSRKPINRSPRKPVRRPVIKKAAAVNPRSRKSAPAVSGQPQAPGTDLTGRTEIVSMPGIVGAGGLGIGPHGDCPLSSSSPSLASSLPVDCPSPAASPASPCWTASPRWTASPCLTPASLASSTPLARLKAGKQGTRSASPKTLTSQPLPETPITEVLPLSAPKEFVVEEDHNPYKCTYEACSKSFRKQNLLDYHVKYYHSNNGKPPAPLPPRKRRKTSSICSTDSDSSVSFTPSTKPIPTPTVPSKRRRHSSSISLPAEGATLPSLPGVAEEVMTTGGDADRLSQSLGEGRARLSSNQEVGEEVIDGEEGNREEVVNCHCGQNEENGLMIQCEVCFCWQHAACFNITPQTLPQRYVCYVCLDPPGVRESSRYVYNHEDWVRHGYLPEFKFCPVVPDRDCKAVAIRTTNALLGDIYNIKTVLQGTRQKLNLLQKPDDPDLRLWYRRWDREVTLSQSTDTTMSTDSSTELPNASANGMEESMDTSDCKGFASEHSYSVSNALTFPQPPCELPQRSSTPSVENQAGQAELLSGGGSDVGSNVHKEAEETMEADAIMSVEIGSMEAASPEHQTSGVTQGSDYGDVRSDDQSEVPPSSDTLQATAQSTVQTTDTPTDQLASGSGWEVAPEIAEHNYQKSGIGGTPAVNQTMDEAYGTTDMVGQEDDVTGSVVGPCSQDVLGETEQLMELMAAADPVRQCKDNLLEHIEGLQLEICHRLDSIEDHVSALESVDADPVADGNILADMPVLKKSLKALIGDLGKVKRLAAFGM
ncbi:PHD finger protein 20-like isoform X3 [Liolophura sinensis]|uniref:PHD finger protein 20-like isoform X3 n=1 Tax=Liolophura sinensis TaxID=3198878 RepID=UPI0031583EAE